MTAEIALETPTLVADPMAGIAAALSADPRLDGEQITQPHPLLVVVRDSGRLVILAPAAVWERGRQILRPFARHFGLAQAALVLVGEPSRRSLDEALHRGLTATVSARPSVDELYVAIHNAFELISARQRSESRGRWLNRYRYELGELIEIAQAITTEREIDKLLALILAKSRFITDADAGSIYVVEGDDPDVARRTLRFKMSQNDTMPFEPGEFTMKISTRSVAGYVALHKKTLNIADAYILPPESPYTIDRSFDEATGYRTKSILCTPLLSRKGDILGVIQLINRKREQGAKLVSLEAMPDQVIAFDQRSEELLSTLSSQAGIALENAILYAENQRMLEGFVRASVEAIEQRDPTTSGHSRRVAAMTVGLAQAVDRSETGVYREVRFTADELRELEYASLLHDFGKIGVREQVLVKAKKLYPHSLEALELRFGLAHRAVEVDVLGRKLAACARGDHEAVAALDLELERRQRELAEALAVIAEANEPKVLSGGDYARIEQLAREVFVDPKGTVRPLLTEQDVTSLMVSRGSLTATEFDEIRSHVVHTFQFLSQIPWGRKFRRVAHIAGAHHERLDGTGYPHRLRASEIPVQSKIMTVSDIFDALTAADRPYKRAVPVARAIDILHMEVQQGHVDGELVRVFVESRPWTALADPPVD
ncbi:MAG: GAF domain-containing protein [Myxococcales bacterium]|nr:GAF domain-containing protein [Myxococcales bacterium]